MSMQTKQKARTNKKKKSTSEPRHITRAVTHIRLQEANGESLQPLMLLPPSTLASVNDM